MIINLKSQHRRQRTGEDMKKYKKMRDSQLLNYAVVRELQARGYYILHKTGYELITRPKQCERCGYYPDDEQAGEQH